MRNSARVNFFRLANPLGSSTQHPTFVRLIFDSLIEILASLVVVWHALLEQHG